ncbi:Serine protease 55 [Orchesella cincta]|uniref:Serine protease 55 n=1 Tax=Orchesella cincta TaxID=48709 RepID=A0A1D2NM04_ORCCI|nr:Serine protease 55 [Orchesella cincta]
MIISSDYCLLLIFGWLCHAEGLAISTKGRKLFHTSAWNKVVKSAHQCGRAFIRSESQNAAASERAARIVGGFKVDSPIPWQVSLQREVSPGIYSHICGGVLISAYHFLTAAHCISPKDRYRVVLGKHKLHSSSSHEQAFDIRQSDIVVHRRFGEIAEYANDIAILKIERANGEGAKLNELIHPICLPESADWEMMVRDSPFSECIVSGFGSINGSDLNTPSNSLRAATVPIHNQNTCDKLYNHEYFDSRGDYGFIESNRLRSIKVTKNSRRSFGGGVYFVNDMLCAGPLSGSKDHCFGDSGGTFTF